MFYTLGDWLWLWSNSPTPVMWWCIHPGHRDRSLRMRTEVLLIHFTKQFAAKWQLDISAKESSLVNLFLKCINKFSHG